MELTSVVINQVVIMFLLIATGYICFKTDLITVEVNKKLSGLVLNLINPALILMSYQIEFKTEYLKGLITAFVLAAISEAASIVLAQLFIRNPLKHDVVIERFAIIYSNCGFMGIPLVNSIFGAQGVFYLTSYLTVFNLLIWTHGVMLMNGKLNLKSVMSLAKNPAIITTVAGLILFVARISIPKDIASTVNYIASMNTPMAMIVAGATVAQTKIIKALAKPRIYLVCFVRLILVPLATLLIFKFLPVDKTVLLTVAIAAACPTGALLTLFSLNYNKNFLYSSEIFAVTTLLSAVTLPIIIMVSGFLIH